jgi:hypothetical protein
MSVRIEHPLFDGGPAQHAGALSVTGGGVPGPGPSLDAERARPFRIS